MADSSVIHDTFTIERTFAVPPARAFAAFASAEAKGVWGDTGELEPVTGEAGAAEFDFRPGGHERFGVRMDGKVFRYDARYYDVVPDARIVYAYEMYADDVRISVSLATLEFIEREGATHLRWTEQGAYLDGVDGVEAPGYRRGGTEEMVDGLARYLSAP